ncbi:major facilitator superfamily transporter [Colletotrichum cuscutae]|uniref:Major facilitator superfamily transporter n=1 Tax=Colletotrichum cuscutae TaxID=1209917 RepID=A0AAI9UX90_9PEZI|nr:major facilitator superfamily transporter [Colletotrichum cuscutae]
MNRSGGEVHAFWWGGVAGRQCRYFLPAVLAAVAAAAKASHYCPPPACVTAYYVRSSGRELLAFPKPPPLPPLPPIYHFPGHYFPIALRFELPPKLAKAKAPPKEGPNLSPRPRRETPRHPDKGDSHDTYDTTPWLHQNEKTPKHFLRANWPFSMVKDLGMEEDAGFYAGLLISAYAVAEAITSMGWGTLSDRIGRKPVVLFGLVGVAISSLIFGFAKTYWVALLARFVGGALNGNVSVMQTMVAEMVKNPDHEPKAYAVQPFVWTLGGIIGSAMGGFLAQPAVYYPSVFSEDGIFGRNPYLLPNLVSMAAISLAVLQGAFFLEETLEFEEDDDLHNGRNSVAVDDDDAVDETTPLRRAPIRTFNPRRSISTSHSRPRFAESSLPLPFEHDFDLRRSSFGTVHSIKVIPEDLRQHLLNSRAQATGQKKVKTFNKTVVMLIIAFIIFSYHQMAAGTLLPTYLLDDPSDKKHPRGQLDFRGGLGYSLHDVGVYLAINGVLGLLIQGLIFPIFVERVGVWGSFISMIIVYPTAYLLLPFLSALPESLTEVGIWFSLIMQSFYGIIIGPVTLILIKNATPTSQALGKVNGVAMSGACLARTVSPPLVGIIYSFAGSAAAWFSCALFAVIGLIQVIWVPKKHIDVDHVEIDNAISRRFSVTSMRRDSIESTRGRRPNGIV